MLTAARKRLREESVNSIQAPLLNLSIGVKRARAATDSEKINEVHFSTEEIVEENSYGREKYSVIGGVRQGLYESFFPNGQPRERAMYVDGHEEGLVQLWFANGRPFRLYTVRDGLKEGTALQWYASGMLASHVTFAAGLEQGRATYYYSCGAVQCEILFRDGEVSRLQHFELE
jgi:antitoxin component YwqK of YwqJK toxin-antitoxin module